MPRRLLHRRPNGAAPQGPLASVVPIVTSCGHTEFTLPCIELVNFLDFFCPHRLRPLVAETRFGLGSTCSIGGFLLLVPPGLLRADGTPTVAQASPSNPPPQSREPFSRRWHTGTVSRGVALQYPLRMRVERCSKMSVPGIESSLRPRHLSLFLLASAADVSCTARAPARPRHLNMPSN